MSEKIYLNLLLFFVILCQEIIATLPDEDNRLSSDFLVRKRRVINHLVIGRRASRIEDFRYVVKIRESNRGHCAGVILSHYSVLTAAPCVRYDKSVYSVLAGSASDQRYTFHEVTSKALYFGNLPHQQFDGIALITIDPPFQFNSRTGFIKLHEGPLPVGTLVTVAGWGYLYPIQPGTEERQRLRSISLPIMNPEECQNEYRGRFNITEKHICTYHPQQYCARNDGGAPVVFNHTLVGIHVWKGECKGQRNPDVYLNLQRADYTAWIKQHTLLM